MKIALVHNAVVPAIRYGGTERVMEWLARGLKFLGHDVSLVALPGSRNPYGETIIPKDFHDWEKSLPLDVDVVHLWGPPAQEPKKPFLVTIGGNGKKGEVFHPNSIFVSRNHATRHGSQHFVHNGIDLNDYVFSSIKEDRAVFLAKASWNVKNLSGAVSLARKAGIPLEVMGSRSWPLNLHRYIPARSGIRYLGMVDDNEKRQRLPAARVLLFPVRWHEPFGLALVEALASGCCVLGTPYGSLPEIVTSEVGFLSNDSAALLEKLNDIRANPNLFSPERCRARVIEGKFTHLDMAKSYLKYYERLLSKGHIGTSPTNETANDSAPRAQEDVSLLEWKAL